MAVQKHPLNERTSPGPDPDQAAITACRNGDVNAFENLVEKYQKQMFNVAYRMIGSYDDAVEVVQDAFVAAFRNINSFEGAAKFTTWLTRIVRNMSINRSKQLSAARYKKTVSLDDYLHNDHGKARHPAADDPTALQRLEREQIQQQIQWCIDGIDIGFREVLVLKDIQDFSYAEIGEALNIPQGTVKSKLYRARDFLKTCLKKAFGDLSHVLS